VLAVLIGLALGPAGSHGGVLSLDPEKGSYDLARFVEVVRDAEARLSIEDVSAASFQSRFSGLARPALHLRADEVVWVRFRVENHGPVVPAPAPWIVEVGNYRLDDMALFRIPGSGGADRPSQTPEELSPLLPSDFEYRYPVFRLVLADGDTVFGRLRAHATMPVPLSLWSPDAFRQHAQRDCRWFGLVYGVLLSMLFFNLFIYVSLRDRLYLLYVAYVACMLAWLLSLNGQHMPLLGLTLRQGLTVLWCALGAVVFSSMVFVKAFLGTRQSTPRLHRVLSLVQALAMGILIFGPLGFERVAHLCAVAAGLGVAAGGLAVGGVRLWQGYRPARYFLMAWTALLLGVATLPLKEVGLLPQAVPGELATNLAAAAESILLSFALADRIRILRKEKEELTISRAHYLRASLTDGLTGLYNRRYFRETLEQALRQADRYRHSLSLLMLDVDDFKSFNDAHGHQAGDEVLRQLAGVMRTSARQSDTPCRYGGEEFVLLLPETGREEARDVAQRLRREIEGRVVEMADGRTGSATISIGVAEMAPGEEADRLIQRADAALYRAKRQGKNRVEVDE